MLQVAESRSTQSPGRLLSLLQKNEKETEQKNTEKNKENVGTKREEFELERNERKEKRQLEKIVKWERAPLLPCSTFI